MAARSLSVSLLTLIALLSAAPALAQPGVNPADVLAGKSAARGGTFADRTARIGSIMGLDVGKAAPMRISAKPEWTKVRRREAAAR